MPGPFVWGATLWGVGGWGTPFPGGSIRQLLMRLTGVSKETAVATYAAWAGLSVRDDDTLFRLVQRKLTVNGRGAQVRESLLATIEAGGAVGSSVQQCLLKTGLTGWS